MGWNIFRNQDIMNFTENENIPALSIAIDIEKAFACGKWIFLRLYVEI